MVDSASSLSSSKYLKPPNTDRLVVQNRRLAARCWRYLLASNYILAAAAPHLERATFPSRTRTGWGWFAERSCLSSLLIVTKGAHIFRARLGIAGLGSGGRFRGLGLGHCGLGFGLEGRLLGWSVYGFTWNTYEQVNCSYRDSLSGIAALTGPKRGSVGVKGPLKNAIFCFLLNDLLTKPVFCLCMAVEHRIVG